MRAWLAAHWIGAAGYVLCVSLAAFLLMGADKRRARRGDWRVPERTLFLAALLGGAPGALLGMWAFRHKTRHGQFRFGLPAILLLQAALAALVPLRRGGLTGARRPVEKEAWPRLGEGCTKVSPRFPAELPADPLRGTPRSEAAA